MSYPVPQKCLGRYANKLESLKEEIRMDLLPKRTPSLKGGEEKDMENPLKNRRLGKRESKISRRDEGKKGNGSLKTIGLINRC